MNQAPNFEDLRRLEIENSILKEQLRDLRTLCQAKDQRNSETELLYFTAKSSLAVHVEKLG